MVRRRELTPDEELRREIREKLIKRIKAMGYPESLGTAVADNLRSVKTMDRMLGYLNASHPRSAEEIVDEMLAIMEDRKRWIYKKESEWANARYNEYLNGQEEED